MAVRVFRARRPRLGEVRQVGRSGAAYRRAGLGCRFPGYAGPNPSRFTVLLPQKARPGAEAMLTQHSDGTTLDSNEWSESRLNLMIL